MEKKYVFMTVVAVVALGFALTLAYAQPQDQEKPMKEAPKKAEKAPQPLCPISGKPVDFAVSIMAEDGPVYFCCPSCIKTFAAEPKKYSEKVAEQRKALSAMPKVQVTCPVSGKPIDKKVFIEKDGKKTYFCCKECPPLYEKDPAKYAVKLAGSYTYQTKCPVTDEEINPTAFLAIEGGPKVYFCCKDCIAKFQKEPAEYCRKMKEQGINVDPAKVKPEGKAEEGKAQEGKPEGKPKAEKEPMEEHHGAGHGQGGQEKH